MVMTNTVMSALPVEVWSNILEQIPKPIQPQLLGVCSLFHDILVGSLFKSIKIYFIGAGRLESAFDINGEGWVKETAEKLMTESWELLNYICQKSRFAQAVKEITVIAFGDGMAVFERSKFEPLCQQTF
jgi:hypothetical protein